MSLCFSTSTRTISKFFLFYLVLSCHQCGCLTLSLFSHRAVSDCLCVLRSLILHRTWLPPVRAKCQFHVYDYNRYQTALLSHFMCLRVDFHEIFHVFSKRKIKVCLDHARLAKVSRLRAHKALIYHTCMIVDCKCKPDLKLMKCH